MTFGVIILFIICALLAAALIKFVAGKVYTHMKKNLDNDKKLNETATWAAIGMIFCATQAIMWLVQGLAYVVRMLV